MSIFTVDSEQVMAANASIQSSITRLQSEVEGLHSQLISLQNSWRGQAADSFQELTARWRQTATLVDNQLGELGHALTLAAKQYSEIEAANARLFMP
jgi:early secretory antigenic target protein ESAT-6